MNGQDVIALNQHRCIFQRRVAGTIDHPHVGQSVTPMDWGGAAASAIGPDAKQHSS